METSPNSRMLGATSIPKNCPVTLRSTERSLWSPQQVMYDNCPEGMSVQHPTPAQLHGQLLHPLSLLQEKEAARWLAGTPSALKCSEVSALQSFHAPAVSQRFISPVIPSLKQSVMNMKGAGQEKREKGRSDSLHSPVTSSRRRGTCGAAQCSSTLRVKEGRAGGMSTPGVLPAPSPGTLLQKEAGTRLATELHP